MIYYINYWQFNKLTYGLLCVYELMLFFCIVYLTEHLILKNPDLFSIIVYGTENNYLFVSNFKTFFKFQIKNFKNKKIIFKQLYFFAFLFYTNSPEINKFK